LARYLDEGRIDPTMPGSLRKPNKKEVLKIRPFPNP
jgi:hypothetical protein